MDPSDLWFSHAQPLEDYDNDVIEFPVVTGQDAKNKNKKKVQKNKMEQRKKLASSSYVITKAPRRALKRIKIEIFDISGGPASSSSNSENSVISAQYIVSEVVDEIMDRSEKLVSEICEKLCKDSCYD